MRFVGSGRSHQDPAEVHRPADHHPAHNPDAPGANSEAALRRSVDRLAGLFSRQDRVHSLCLFYFCDAAWFMTRVDI